MLQIVIDNTNPQDGITEILIDTDSVEAQTEAHLFLARAAQYIHELDTQLKTLHK